MLSQRPSDEAHEVPATQGGPPSEAVENRSAAEGRSFWFDVQVWIRDVFISVAIAAIVIVFLYQPVKVEGTSMMPWLEDQQRIFVNKFVYSVDDIQRGDVVVFRFPLDPTKSYIKRVLGLPGDRVEVIRGDVLVNGNPVEEPYVPSAYQDRSSHPALEIPDGQFYVLGDHRNTSNDSRTWGTVPRSYITGKAVFAYWPLDRFGVLD